MLLLVGENSASAIPRVGDVVGGASNRIDEVASRGVAVGESLSFRSHGLNAPASDLIALGREVISSGPIFEVTVLRTQLVVIFTLEVAGEEDFIDHPPYWHGRRPRLRPHSGQQH